MNKKVTLADIARKSSVSLSTVSLVLRDKPGIPPETRKRVLDTAQSLGYRRKIRAGVQGPEAEPLLRSLGVIIKIDDDEAPLANPFYMHVMAGIEEICRKQKVNLLYATLPVDSNNVPVEVPRLLTEQHADGLLLVGLYIDSAFGTLFTGRREPVVLVDGYAEDESFDAVVSDNVGGATEAVTRLIEAGHRRIGFVGGHAQAYPSLRERRQAWQQTLTGHGLRADAVVDSGLKAADGATAALQLLERYPDVTALFGVNDQIAIAAMQAAQSLGRRVPDDLAVIGFDDIELARHVSPAITTMRVDKVGMGRLAVQLIQNRLEFPDSERVVAVLKPRLVERDSAGGTHAVEGLPARSVDPI